MRTVVLIACASKKQPVKTMAKDFYTSPLFRLSLSYAYQLNPSAVYILSASYGLVELNDMLEPYDKTLNYMKKDDIKLWADKVLAQLHEKVDVDKVNIVFLAGNKYRQFLIPHLKHYEIPLKGMSIGKQLKFLKAKTYG